MISFRVNGENVSFDGDTSTPLLWVLRDHLQLKGSKFGCGIGQCGACSVHVEGKVQRSCITPVSAIAGAGITTIEGLAPSEEKLHPVQQAWMEMDVPQCGYCQAGQIMTASAFLEKNPSPSREEIREAMHGNICRCASYSRIESAVVKAAEKLS